jgi:hypothetical protein
LLSSLCNLSSLSSVVITFTHSCNFHGDLIILHDDGENLIGDDASIFFLSNFYYISHLSNTYEKSNNLLAVIPQWIIMSDTIVCTPKHEQWTMNYDTSSCFVFEWHLLSSFLYLISVDHNVWLLSVHRNLNNEPQ